MLVNSKTKVAKSRAKDLVRVPVRPGVFVKIPRADAIAQGLIPDPNAQKPKPKRRRRSSNKQRLPKSDKSEDNNGEE